MKIKPLRSTTVVLRVVLLTCTFLVVATAVADPLPAWNDGRAKQSILAFVKAVTDPTSPSFVTEEKRIATFDNDGTLWVSHSLYTQFVFAFERVRELAPAHPAWKHEQPYKAILAGDREFLKTMTIQDAVKIVMTTHAGITPRQFEAIVHKWLATATHPRFHVPYTALVYQPMLELLAYLRANGFKTFIVTGGGIDFVRAYAKKTYGVPPWQVVGSRIKNKFELVDGKAELLRLPEIEFINNGPGKTIGIGAHIGLRPIAAFGNSDGDIEMLEYTDSGKEAHLEMMVHHDDAQREYAYDCDTQVGRLCEGLKLAKERGWVLISMKNDWNRIFSFEGP